MIISVRPWLSAGNAASVVTVEVKLISSSAVQSTSVLSSTILFAVVGRVFIGIGYKKKQTLKQCVYFKCFMSLLFAGSLLL